jgi:hypothetical protein
MPERLRSDEQSAQVERGPQSARVQDRSRQHEQEGESKELPGAQRRRDQGGSRRAQEAAQHLQAQDSRLQRQKHLRGLFGLVRRQRVQLWQAAQRLRERVRSELQQLPVRDALVVGQMLSAAQGGR